MRVAIGLVAVVLGLALTASARAQDPLTYDPTFYEEQDALNPANPHSLAAARQRKLKALQQPNLLVKAEITTVKMAVGVTTTVASGVATVSKLWADLNDPNTYIPGVSSGPGSPLQQPGSLTGTTAQAESGKPLAAPQFATPPTGKSSLMPSLFGPPSPAGTNPGVPKMQ